MDCLNCGKPGPHFVGPSLGEPGFFTCEKEEQMQEQTQSVNPLVEANSPEVPLEAVKTNLVGDDTPKMTNCPQCNTEIGEGSIKAIRAGKKMHMEGKAYRAVVTICAKCGHSFGFSGLTGVRSAYQEAPQKEHKKRSLRKAQKQARRKNRR